MVLSPQTRVLLDLIDQAYNRQSWHGTNLRGSIRGVSAATAARRPARGRHSIWEEVVHCAYWKYVVWRRITGSERGSFPLAGSNWFGRPTRGNERAWRQDIALLEQCHRTLRATVARLSAKDLARRSVKGSPFSVSQTVSGIAAHDLYHAGQIQLLKKLVRRA